MTAVAGRAANRGGGDGGGGRSGGGDRDVVSFDSDWDQTARDSFGELGPAEVTVPAVAGPAKAATGTAIGVAATRGRRPGGGGGGGRGRR